MNSVADEDLMLQVRDGAGEMLGVLFDRYHVPLYNFYSRLLGDRTVSEDLVQEVFLKILRYRESYRPGTPFRPWIYQIARNASIDYFRKHPRRTTLDLDRLPPVLPKDSTQQDQEASLLHRALMQLPEEKREVLILARFQELKYEEIAQLLGCELNTVKSRVHRSLQELKENYQRLERVHATRASSPAPPSNTPPRRLGNEL